MNDIQVSVIVPVYNVEAYLPTCLDSLVNQTLADIEILVVNDGSTDGSAAIAKEYAARDARIRVFDKKNGGLSDARNYALPHARGEYIAFVDSDDYVDTAMYATMVDKAHATDADVVVCAYTEIRYGTATPLSFADAMGFYGHSVTESPRLLDSANSYAWNKIYRRSFWMEHGFAFPVGQWYEDSALIYNVLGSANRVACVDRPFYHYTVKRAGSITGTVNEKIFDALLSVESILRFYQTLPQSPALQEQVYCLCLRHALVRLQNFPRTKNRRLARAYIRRCYVFFDANLPGWQNCGLLHPPASASLKKKVLAFIKRHRWLASVCYVGFPQYLLLTLYDKVSHRG